MANLLVSTVKVAETLRLSTRRVRQLVELGMPREKAGRYDLAKCMLWYIRHLQREIERRELDNSPESTALRAQRLRLLTAQAAREELELARESVKLIPVNEYDAMMAEHVTAVRQRFLAVPANIAPGLEGEDRESIKLKLEKEIY